MKSFIIIIAITTILPSLFSCSNSTDKKQVKKMYESVALERAPDRNPVILIPGILGSKLRDTNTKATVWGAFSPGAILPNKPSSKRLIGLPLVLGKALTDLKDTVIPAGALDRFRITLLPGVTISPKGYAQLLQVLGAGGYADETLGKAGTINYGHDHYSCFQFSYDWRKSSAFNAAELDKFITAKREFVMAQRKKQYPNRKFKPVKFDIVAHSMGGLLTRYYLRYGSQKLPATGTPILNWAGAKHVDKVAIISTPHYGSPLSITNLTDGIKPTPLVPRYDPVLLGTMPSGYELLPRKRHGLLIDPVTLAKLDPLDPKVWVKYQWGLANPKFSKTLAQLLPNVSSPEERTKIAYDHLTKSLNSARQFHLALDRKPTNVPPHLKMVTWVGDVGATQLILKAKLHSPKWHAKGYGDHTVPRFSAVADDRGPLPNSGTFKSPVPWRDINYLQKDHLGITKDSNFADNLLAFLLEQGGSIQ